MVSDSQIFMYSLIAVDIDVVHSVSIFLNDDKRFTRVVSGGERSVLRTLYVQCGISSELSVKLIYLLSAFAYLLVKLENGRVQDRRLVAIQFPR